MPLDVCTHTLAPHAHDISHTGLTPLMKSTSCSPCFFFFLLQAWVRLEVVWWKSLFCLIGLKSSQAAHGEIFGLHLLVVSHRLDGNGSMSHLWCNGQSLLLYRPEDHRHSDNQIRSRSQCVALNTPSLCKYSADFSLLCRISVITAFPRISHCHIIFVTLLNLSLSALFLVLTGL